MSVNFLRTMILYIVIIIAVRIMGKRQIGELSPTELVITILISNIATLPIEDTNIPLTAGLVSIFTLVACEVLVSGLILKSPKMRRMISGSPRVLIRDGVIDQQQLAALRLSIDDLTAQLRGQGCFDINQVAFAVVETTGKLNIFQKFGSQQPTNQGLHVKEPKNADAPPTVVISDGQISDAALQFCQKDKGWLGNLLQEKQCPLEEVFLMTCDRSGNYKLIKKEAP
ncbi:MAG: DUF421 domain-containing protein [Oscillospiraceae bacterium]|nr:DUF421 domain-containing protein [Oscillospiraceae bacterium]